MGESQNPEPSAKLPASKEEELGRKAAELVKASKPQFRRLMAFTRPRAETAGKQAARYVREHESEIKQAAVKLARARVTGPLGMLADTLVNAATSEAGSKPRSLACGGCGTSNALSAKFCSECGAKLVVAE